MNSRGKLVAVGLLALAGALPIADTARPVVGMTGAFGREGKKHTGKVLEKERANKPEIPSGSPSGGIISTVAGDGNPAYLGDGGPAVSAQLSYPRGVAVDGSGNLYIADQLNNRVRKVAGGIITTVAGTGTYLSGYSGDGVLATTVEIDPIGVAVDGTGNIYIADLADARILKVTVANGLISTVAGNGIPGYAGDGGPATSAKIQPWGVAVDGAGNIYIADYWNNCVRKVAGGIITTIAGIGGGLGDYTGDGGAATSAELRFPMGVAVDASGNVYIADWGNDVVRKVASGIITTVAGNGTMGLTGDGGPAASAQLLGVGGVAVDGAGNFYFSEWSGGFIRKVTVATGIISTVAGDLRYPGGVYGGDGGPATLAHLNNPFGVTLDASGNIYIADTYSHRIRKVTASH